MGVCSWPNSVGHEQQSCQSQPAQVVNSAGIRTFVRTSQDVCFLAHPRTQTTTHERPFTPT